MTVDQIQTELNTTLEPLDCNCLYDNVYILDATIDTIIGLPGFYKIPASFKLASTQRYKSNS